MLSREEKLANKLLIKYNLSIPFNLYELSKKFADICIEELPFDADGLTIEVKSQRPTIYINSKLSKSREKFTIAHELGHILLPWHIGTIISDINNYSLSDHISYRKIEKEANLFASELLMPTNWCNTILNCSTSFKLKLQKALTESGCSLEAILIKLHKLCMEFRYILIVDSDNFCKRIYACNPQSHLDFLHTYFDPTKYLHLDNLEEFTINKIKIITFTVGHYDPKIFIHNSELNWQDIIRKILSDLKINEENNKTLLRVNAILGNKIHDYNDLSVEETCQIIRLRFEGRDLDHVVEHSLFPIYIQKRVKELKQKHAKKQKIKVV